MKLRGGYNVTLKGKPGNGVELLPEPKILYLPLKSRRFEFTDVRVEEGQTVQTGQMLAKDPANYSVPLLAPRAGTVSLSAVEGHIVLTDVSPQEGPTFKAVPDEHVPYDPGSNGMKRYKLLTLGAWQFFHDAFSQELPDPFGTPSAVIVSTLNLEPFVVRGDVQIRKRLERFTHGLEHLQSLLEYQPIYLVVPDINSELAQKVSEAIRGYAWVKLVQVPLVYPYDNFTLLARSLGLKNDPENPVWAVRAGGMLAFERALTRSRPCTVRIISLSGPAVKSPVNLKAISGYPISDILAGRIDDGPVRVINGGVLSGETIDPQQTGLGVENDGLTVLTENTKREMLGFVRPGLFRRSYSNAFVSALRGSFEEKFNTAVRGEGRPCVACGYCEEVCPAAIMPHLLHKLLYQDELEEVERSRVDLCIECGLCSFVCPSKIELREQFIEGKKKIREELHAQEVEA